MPGIALSTGDAVIKKTDRVSSLEGRAFSKLKGGIISEPTRSMEAINQGYATGVRMERML